MGLLNIIRRMHLRQKLSIHEIARLTRVSRNTVTKHLAANTIEPKFATPERQSKIDSFAEKLAGWLKTEAGNAALWVGLCESVGFCIPPVCADRMKGEWLSKFLQHNMRGKRTGSGSIDQG